MPTSPAQSRWGRHSGLVRTTSMSFPAAQKLLAARQMPVSAWPSYVGVEYLSPRGLKWGLKHHCDAATPRDQGRLRRPRPFAQLLFRFGAAGRT